MTTNALLQKYHDNLVTITAEAAETVEEAQNQFNSRKSEHEAAQRELANLKETMNSNHRSFFGAAKAILAMVYKRPSTPEEIGEAIFPIINYQAALAAVPAAEEMCDSTQQTMLEASDELYKAKDLFVAFNTLKCSAEGSNVE